MSVTAEAGLSRMSQGHGGAHGPADAAKHAQTRMAASEAT